jgi:hypothetical protein
MRDKTGEGTEPTPCRALLVQAWWIRLHIFRAAPVSGLDIYSMVVVVVGTVVVL